MPNWRYWAEWARRRAEEFGMYMTCTRDRMRLQAVIDMHLAWAREYDLKAEEQEARLR